MSMRRKFTILFFTAIFRHNLNIRDLHISYIYERLIFKNCKQIDKINTICLLIRTIHTQTT